MHMPATARAHLLRQCQQNCLILQALHVLIGVWVEGLKVWTAGGAVDVETPCASENSVFYRISSSPSAFTMADASRCLAHLLTFRLLFHSSSRRSKKAPRLPHTWYGDGGPNQFSALVDAQAGCLPRESGRGQSANYLPIFEVCTCLGLNARLWFLRALIFGRCISETDMPVLIKQNLLFKRIEHTGVVV